ncbi:MAG: TonB family protein [Archangiaceae bacterium]|nr:TonB family protein [Archangiaceae bacterium]
MKRSLLATLLALGGHGLFLLFILFVSLLQLHLPPMKRVPTKSAVSLRGVPAQQWAQNRGDPRQQQDDKNQTAQRERKKEEKKPDPEKDPKGQVVAVSPGNDQVDPNAKYVSETSNKVQKESRAKETSAFYRNAMPKRTSPNPQEGNGADSVDKAQVSGNNGIGQDDRPLREGKQQQMIEVPDVKKRSEIAMRNTSPSKNGADVSNRTETEAVQGNSDRLKIQPGAQGGGEDQSEGRTGTPGVANLLPSPAVLDKITGAAANDHLEDVDEGEGTYLNTKEWKFASFFNRVKQSVSQQWNPGQQLRLRDPTGNIYGGRDRYTVLAVTLNNNGNVREIYVEKSCGLDFLDLEAIQAFERSQPFPNPPPGLVQADSSVRFQFGFFLEMSGRPRMRLFRAQD